MVIIAGITSLDKAVKRQRKSRWLEPLLVDNYRHLVAEEDVEETLHGGVMGRGRGAQNFQGRGNRGRGGSSGGHGGRAIAGRSRYSPRGGGAVRGQGNCYICNSPNHWSNRCPQRNQNRQGESRTARGGHRGAPSRAALHMAMGADAPERRVIILEHRQQPNFLEIRETRWAPSWPPRSCRAV